MGLESNQSSSKVGANIDKGRYCLGLGACHSWKYELLNLLLLNHLLLHWLTCLLSLTVFFSLLPKKEFTNKEHRNCRACENFTVQYCAGTF